MSFEKYLKQMTLLIRLLPYVLKDERLALKGGTAINLFYRNLPRISVDIDLVYLPLEDRKRSFMNIHSILKKIKEDLESSLIFQGIKITSSWPLDGQKETKLFIEYDGNRVKVEPNFTLRSAVGNVINKNLCSKASELTFLGTNIHCLSLEDLYGGKICAALDRQHPRDLFDIKILMENEGITKEIKDVFLFYLVSTNRPIVEMLNPAFKSIEKIFNEEFVGMYEGTVQQSDLEKTREELVETINSLLSDRDKDFLLSIAANNPNWSLAPVKDMQNYPSIKWKIHNVGKMSEQNRKDNFMKLKKFLYEVKL